MNPEDLPVPRHPFPSVKSVPNDKYLDLSTDPQVRLDEAIRLLGEICWMVRHEDTLLDEHMDLIDRFCLVCKATK